MVDIIFYKIDLWGGDSIFIPMKTQFSFLILKTIFIKMIHMWLVINTKNCTITPFTWKMDEINVFIECIYLQYNGVYMWPILLSLVNKKNILTLKRTFFFNLLYRKYNVVCKYVKVFCLASELMCTNPWLPLVDSVWSISTFMMSLVTLPTETKFELHSFSICVYVYYYFIADVSSLPI